MASTERSLLAKLGLTGLWVLTILDFLGLGLAGFAKFQGDTWQNLFVDWGYPGGFSYVIGALEMVGAALLLIPRLTSYAATLLIAIMLGALFTVLTNENQLGPVMPVVHLVILSILLRARWNSRWRPGGTGTQSES